jgi:hypothetical protein
VHVGTARQHQVRTDPAQWAEVNVYSFTPKRSHILAISEFVRAN